MYQLEGSPAKSCLSPLIEIHKLLLLGRYTDSERGIRIGSYKNVGNKWPIGSRNWERVFLILQPKRRVTRAFMASIRRIFSLTGRVFSHFYIKDF